MRKWCKLSKLPHLCKFCDKNVFIGTQIGVQLFQILQNKQYRSKEFQICPLHSKEWSLNPLQRLTSIFLSDPIFQQTPFYVCASRRPLPRIKGKIRIPKKKKKNVYILKNKGIILEQLQKMFEGFIFYAAFFLFKVAVVRKISI